MKAPICRRFHRKCEDFTLCVNIGEKGYVLAEHPNERYTLFHYASYGSGKIGKIFESDYTLIESKKLVDVRDYVNSEVVFQAHEDFCLIGFNTMDKNIHWDAKVLNVDTKIIKENKNSILICLDGDMIVNDKKFKRYHYTTLNSEEEYYLEMNQNTAAIIFTKI
jgi:hypothetical protein